MGKPIVKPIRVPVRRPVRVEEPTESIDDDQFRKRLKGKVQALPPQSQVFPPQLLEGVGQLFTSDKIDGLSESELEERVNFSVNTKDGDLDWIRLLVQMIKVSCAFTAQEILRGPPEPPYNGRFLLGDHHLDWDAKIRAHRRLCILAPRDHSKTYFFDFAYPIWQILNKPKGSGFIFSSTQPQAERILDDIRFEIESNPRLEWLVPRKKTKWGSRYLKCSNGHRIYARGFGTRVRGAHPSWIVVDDGLNDETAYSDTVRTKQKDYFYTAITNMIVPGGQILVIGTPFSAQDLYADLKDNPEYHFAEYPAESNPGQPDNKALWADRYSLEDLARRRQEIGSIRYTREFLVKPVADEMSLFPSHLFKGTDVEQFNLKLGMPYEFWKEAGITPYMGVDFAMSTNVQADFTVIWVVGVDKLGNRWLIDMEREKGLPYQEQLSLINTLGRKYQPALIFLEDNQMQRIFGDELIRTSDLPIKKFTTGVQKNSLDKGVPSLRVLLENKKFRIPRGDRETIEKIDIWIEEMRSITWLEGKIQSVAGHDDTVLAMWICDQAIRTGGFQFTFGNEDEFTGLNTDGADALMKELTGESQQTVSLTGFE